MKRRSFIKKGAVGLTFLAIGTTGAKQIKKRKRRLFGRPDSIRRRPSAERNRIRYSLARTDLPPIVWDEVVALSALAHDVFESPELAQAFTDNPRGYLESIGLDETALDPSAIEVKAALALGDPAIRRALERDNPEDFLAVLEKRGLLQAPDRSQLSSDLARHIERIEAMQGKDASPEACSAVVVCAALALATVWVWVVLIQDVAAAVNVAALATISVTVLVYTGTITPRYMEPESGLLRRQTPFRLATTLGGNEFTDRTIRLFIDRNVERIAAAVEGLSIYRHRSPLPMPDLRGLIRAHLVRQLSGHAVAVPPSLR